VGVPKGHANHDGVGARFMIDLNKLGAAGWQLVNFVIGDPTMGTNELSAVLKRPAAGELEPDPSLEEEQVANPPCVRRLRCQLATSLAISSSAIGSSWSLRIGGNGRTADRQLCRGRSGPGTSQAQPRSRAEPSMITAAISAQSARRTDTPPPWPPREYAAGPTRRRRRALHVANYAAVRMPGTFPQWSCTGANLPQASALREQDVPCRSTEMR
jgi:hypothetical protein